MLKINFKKCCQECKYIDTYIESTPLIMNGESYYVDTTIGCNHEKVCEWYVTEVAYIKIPQDDDAK